MRPRQAETGSNPRLNLKINTMKNTIHEGAAIALLLIMLFSLLSSCAPAKHCHAYQYNESTTATAPKKVKPSYH